MLTISLAKKPEQKIEVFVYTKHNFGARNLSTCAHYALHQVAKSNAKDKNLVKALQRNFYMD